MREPITGAHGGEIVALALTADGGAAVTADRTGGVRLWPTLDGTREPIVIHAPASTALAIARDGGGFAIAVTDAAAHVELVRVDGKGRVRSRRQLGEAQQVEVVGESLLVLRVDQVIDQIALDGTPRAQLAAEPGTRIDALVGSGANVVALIAGENHRQAWRIELARLAWGERSAALPIAGDAIAVLTPDAKSLLAKGTDQRIMRFELATATAKPACPAERWPSSHDGEFGAIPRLDAAPIGVVGNRVACVTNGVFSWFDIETGAITTANVGSTEPALMAAAADRVVVASQHELVIATPERTAFLGYGVRDLTKVRVVPTGLMIGKGDQEPVLLDDSFRERARFALPKLRVNWIDIMPVDDRYIITSSTRPAGNDPWDQSYQISVYDAVKQVMHQVLPDRARSGELAYEPSTRLLVTSDGHATMLARLEPATHALGSAVTIDVPDVPTQIALLDPKLSGGLIALAIRDEGGGVIVSELYAADMPAQEVEAPRARRSVKPRTTYRISGDLRGVDRAGRLYVYDARHAHGIGVYVRGTHKGVLAGTQLARLRTSPDARYVVAVDNGRLALFTTAGQRVWEKAMWGMGDADWTPTGVLFARFPHALARIDVETGTLLERQCGWGFGISTTSRDTSSNEPSVCDVAP